MWAKLRELTRAVEAPSDQQQQKGLMGQAGTVTEPGRPEFGRRGNRAGAVILERCSQLQNLVPRQQWSREKIAQLLPSPPHPRPPPRPPPSQLLLVLTIGSSRPEVSWQGSLGDGLYA